MDEFIKFFYGIQLLFLSVIYLVSCLLAEFILFWVFGVWAPWYVAAIFGIFCPFVYPCWLVLWVLTWVPAIHFPIVH